MFCPECGAEYVQGITTCADCQVPLVAEKPPEEVTEYEYVEYDEVLRTFNPADIGIIRSLLDAAGITYFFKGENFAFAQPLADPARLMVKRDEADQAREILKDLIISYGVSSGGHGEEKTGPAGGEGEGRGEDEGVGEDGGPREGEGRSGDQGPGDEASSEGDQAR